MKRIFKGKQINTKQPTPKKGQVWEDKSGNLVHLYEIENKGVSAFFEHEDGSKFSMGFAWLDGVNYTYVGEIL